MIKNADADWQFKKMLAGKELIMGVNNSIGMLINSDLIIHYSH